MLSPSAIHGIPYAFPGHAMEPPGCTWTCPWASHGIPWALHGEPPIEGGIFTGRGMGIPGRPLGV
eukprot:2903249-Lingulodinium_polyedra.AAC.1